MKMEVVVERKRPRGNFLNLFDWPGKSKKKLFSSNVSQISEEETKQSKENAQDHSVNVKNSTYNNPRSDSSCCASSVTSDDGNVVRASVVARLMGLERLPQPNEPRLEPDLDPYFLRSSRRDDDHFDGVSWDHSDSRTRKRMIERFQTETLPPKSAKPISITHNKLLSPIRNPGFVPSRNPAHVMEAASKMFEPSTRMMMARTRVVPSSDSPSPVPLRIRDLKEKLEAAQKASTSKKSHSFSAQAKANSNQKKDNKRTLSSSGQKEKPEAKNRAVRSQNGLKESSLSTRKNVLKQNYQKQNCGDNNQQPRKVSNKVVNKVLVESGSTSKSSGFSISSVETSTSRKKSLPRSKKPRNGLREPEDKRIKRGDKLIKCNISVDSDGSSKSKDDQKRDMDVISFTFSSSIKGLSSSHSQGTKQDSDSAVKFNVIGGDSLNALLEQKLRELTSKIDSSSSSLIQEESLSSVSKEKASEMMISSPSKHSESTQTSVSECTSFYNNPNFQKKTKIHGEEHEVSSINTLTEADDSALSCSKSFSEYGMKKSLSDQELTCVPSAALDWELEYITEILNSSQLMFQDFALRTATTSEPSSLLLLPSRLFDEMECSRGATMSTKMERKALFDCVNQYLTSKFERILLGRSSKEMMMMVLEHRDLLVEEVNREVKGMKKMREMMIDELVDHDMSCYEGRWIGYEREVFEEGIDIEGEIVSALVDDLVCDLFSSWS